MELRDTYEYKLGHAAGAEWMRTGTAADFGGQKGIVVQAFCAVRSRFTDEDWANYDGIFPVDHEFKVAVSLFAQMSPHIAGDAAIPANVVDMPEVRTQNMYWQLVRPASEFWAGMFVADEAVKPELFSVPDFIKGCVDGIVSSRAGEG